MTEAVPQAKNNEEIVESNGKKDEEPVFVNKEDRLEAENIHLRVVNLAHEAQMLQAQLQDKSVQIQQLQQDILAKRLELEEKYSIDLSTHEIRETDGQVIARSNQNSVARMMQQLGQKQIKG